MEETRNTPHDLRRVIVIDDTESIHRDYDKILAESLPSESEQALQALDSLMFEEEEREVRGASHALDYDVAHAMQGKEGYEMILAARESGRPFAVAFVDMRMPPGWDGLQTIERIWEADPDIQVVICSAYADYTWNQIIDRLGNSDRLLILKKPFDQAEVYQLATALSEKWLAERSTRELLATLEEKVEQRTLEVRSANGKLMALNQELEEAAHQAQCAARAKGRFLATMSHEIRTTLNGIMGAAHMLNNARLPESEREFAEIIQTSGEALMIIINDILDYSKYETGQIELETIPFSLRGLLDECAALLESVIQKNSVNFETRWDRRLPPLLRGDPARLRQVLLNLINNAIKFAKGGNVTVACSLLEADGGSARVKVEVLDDGIGMGPETVKRLFTAFMQADSSTTRQYGGTGLGLAICKLLADAMEADLSVTSRLGQGSTFAFELSLPIAEEDAERPATQSLSDAKAAAAKESSPGAFEGKRVLLVDDNAVNCKLGKHFLAKLGVHARLAYNGLEAVKQVKESPPFDLILMDLQMPEMDGLQATQAIRLHEHSNPETRRPVPIIALTANAFTEVRDDCLKYGMSDFLTKPLRIDELSQMLVRWLLQTDEDASKPTR